MRIDEKPEGVQAVADQRHERVERRAIAVTQIGQDPCHARGLGRLLRAGFPRRWRPAIPLAGPLESGLA